MISIYTPTNAPSFLPAIYQSLLTQEYKDWEWVILLNNGPEEGSYEAINKLTEDSRVKIFKDTTRITAVGYLKRRACELCSGDILLELDHDDLLLPGALLECAVAFRDPAVIFAYSNTVNHDVRTNTPVTWSSTYGWSTRAITPPYVESVSAAPYPQSISRIWFAPNHFRAWRTQAYWKIGGHNATMAISDDHDLLCRTYLHGKMAHIDKPLYLYRVHGQNTWLKHQEEIQATMWAVHDRYIEAMAQKWSSGENLRKIDLCGGIDSPPGYESVDLFGATITADLNDRWPFQDNSVGLIRAHDAIEHLRNPIHTMNEAWRVLAHGGFLLIKVPSSDGVGADCDPTHVSRWNWRSFRYYTEAAVQRYIKSAGANCRFQKIKVECKTLHDGVPYTIAHLIAIKKDAPRFYGELLI